MIGLQHLKHVVLGMIRAEAAHTLGQSGRG
jgi:hypothetical protein